MENTRFRRLRCKTSWPVDLRKQIVLSCIFAFVLLCGFTYKAWPYTPNFCGFNLLFQSPCAGCGLSRSVAEFLTGNFKSSIFLHPLGPTVSIAACYGLFRSLLSIALRKKLAPAFSQYSRKLLGSVIIAVLLSQWFLRLFILFQN